MANSRHQARKTDHYAAEAADTAQAERHIQAKIDRTDKDTKPNNGATHLLPRGIRVNAVAPGPVWTPLNPADKSAERVAEFGSDTPMKRPAQPEEIAPAYVFLASPACSSYITGEILPIIGGYSGG